MTKPTIFTIGHSTRPIEEFIGLLRANGIARLVDVRTVPKSRHNPQFAIDALGRSLGKAGIAYVHLETLGGLRRAAKDSKNTGWRNASFRGYADYMATPGFAEGLDELMDLAKRDVTAIMCAEAVPWRCHRSLIADVLSKKGWIVLDIIGAAPPKRHRLTPFLRVRKGVLVYPPSET